LSKDLKIDVETTLLKFIDIMETFQESINKTLINSSVLEIVDNLKTMNNKFERSQEVSQFNLSKCVSLHSIIIFKAAFLLL
jgi:hypothetical protein